MKRCDQGTESYIEEIIKKMDTKGRKFNEWTDFFLPRKKKLFERETKPTYRYCIFGQCVVWKQ